MRVLSRLFTLITMFLLVACSSKSSSGYENVVAVVTSPNGNLYVLTETLDYEFPSSRATDIKLFFELAPAFSDIEQPISARMWVKERSVDFSFDDAILSIHKENDYKFTRNESKDARNLYSKNSKARQLLKNLQRMVKQDRSSKLAIKHDETEINTSTYTLITNKKVKNDKIRGKVVEILNRKGIIRQYQSLSGNFKDYRINIFYEPSVVDKGLLGNKIDKKTLVAGDGVTIRNWRRVLPLSTK